MDITALLIILMCLLCCLQFYVWQKLFAQRKVFDEKRAGFERDRAAWQAQQRSQIEKERRIQVMEPEDFKALRQDAVSAAGDAQAALSVFAAGAARLSEAAGTLSGRYSAEKEKLKERAAALDAQAQSLELQKLEFSKQKEDAAALDAEISAREADLNALSRTLSEKEAALSDLESKIEAERGVIADVREALDTECAESKSRFADAKRLHEQSKAEAAALLEKISAFESAKSEFEEIRESVRAKMTARADALDAAEETLKSRLCAAEVRESEIIKAGQDLSEREENLRIRTEDIHAREEALKKGQAAFSALTEARSALGMDAEQNTPESGAEMKHEEEQ